MDNGAGKEIYKKGIEADVSTSEDEDENKVEPVSEEEKYLKYRKRMKNLR